MPKTKGNIEKLRNIIDHAFEANGDGVLLVQVDDVFVPITDALSVLDSKGSGHFLVLQTDTKMAVKHAALLKQLKSLKQVVDISKGDS